MESSNFSGVTFTWKDRNIMNLGKDFWFILKILRIIIEVLSQIGKKENDDTPAGQE